MSGPAEGLGVTLPGLDDAGRWLTPAQPVKQVLAAKHLVEKADLVRRHAAEHAASRQMVQGAEHHDIERGQIRLCLRVNAQSDTSKAVAGVRRKTDAGNSKAAAGFQHCLR